jgi:hypothetical protein
VYVACVWAHVCVHTGVVVVVTVVVVNSGVVVVVVVVVRPLAARVWVAPCATRTWDYSGGGLPPWSGVSIARWHSDVSCRGRAR